MCRLDGIRVGRTEYRSAWLCYNAPPHGPSYLRAAEVVVPERRENSDQWHRLFHCSGSEHGCSVPAFKELRSDAEIKECERQAKPCITLDVDCCQKHEGHAAAADEPEADRIWLVFTSPSKPRLKISHARKMKVGRPHSDNQNGLNNTPNAVNKRPSTNRRNSGHPHRHVFTTEKNRNRGVLVRL